LDGIEHYIGGLPLRHYLPSLFFSFQINSSDFLLGFVFSYFFMVITYCYYSVSMMVPKSLKRGTPI